MERHVSTQALEELLCHRTYHSDGPWLAEEFEITKDTGAIGIPRLLNWPAVTRDRFEEILERRHRRLIVE
jgi:hypothetical protein